MAVLFCVRPATRNIGNDIISRATSDLLYQAFGDSVGIVNVPALKGPQFGGFTVGQVYDMNRFADGVVLGGGNLFENGQVTVEPQALASLRVPLLLTGLSHGRIYGRNGALVERTDGMPEGTIRLFVDKALDTLVRDIATQARLERLTSRDIKLGGCPTIFMPPTPAGGRRDGSVLISVRHPNRMSVPPGIQWRVAEDVRRMIATLRAEISRDIVLVCHDYADIEFASSFDGARVIYFDDVDHYIDALRRCSLSVSYRLHAFLPCFAFGTPAIHISYDERGRSMLETIGMADWDIDLITTADVVADVLARARNADRFLALRDMARPGIEAMRETSMAGLTAFAASVAAYRASCERGRNA
jgi:hypothetical protein